MDSVFDHEAIRTAVRRKYAEISKGAVGRFPYLTGIDGARALGYDLDELAKLPEELLRSFCGVGNPFVDGPIETGSAVLDVGCGSGVDIILAGRHAGDTGRVCGIDLTPEMASLARENATIAGLARAEIREAPAESIPYGDGTFDVVISNGVLNLSPDKERAFQEIFRVLAPEGRLQFADIVLEGDRPREAPLTIDAWSD